ECRPCEPLHRAPSFARLPSQGVSAYRGSIGTFENELSGVRTRRRRPRRLPLLSASHLLIPSRCQTRRTAARPPRIALSASTTWFMACLTGGGKSPSCEERPEEGSLG